MSERIQEHYRPVPIAANGSFVGEVNQLGGFLCVTSGTLTVVDGAGVTVVATIAVTAGVYLPLPFDVGGGRVGATASATSRKTTVTLAGGASGTLGVA